MKDWWEWIFLYTCMSICFENLGYYQIISTHLNSYIPISKFVEIERISLFFKSLLKYTILYECLARKLWLMIPIFQGLDLAERIQAKNTHLDHLININEKFSI